MDTSVNDIMRLARNKKKLTQKEVAERMGVKQGTYAQWENSNRRPTDATLDRFAHALGYSTFQSLTNSISSPEDVQLDYVEVEEENEEFSTLAVDICQLIVKALRMVDFERITEVLDFVVNLCGEQASIKQKCLSEDITNAKDEKDIEKMQNAMAWINDYLQLLKEATQAKVRYKEALQTRLDSQTEESGQTADTDS